MALKEKSLKKTKGPGSFHARHLLHSCHCEIIQTRKYVQKKSREH